MKKIKEIIENNTDSNLSEEKTKQSIIEPILSKLGWNLTSLDEVQREYKNIVDYRLKGKRNTIYIEAKRFGKSLVSAMQQVKDYSLQSYSRPDFLITTNGIDWDCYSIRYAILLFSFNLKSIEKNDESIFYLISKENVNNGLLMNYSNEMKTQLEVLEYLKRNTNKIAEEITLYDSSFNQESIKKIIYAITQKSYIRVSPKKEMQKKYSNHIPISQNLDRSNYNNFSFSGSHNISSLKKDYLFKVANRLKYMEKEIDSKCYVKFGLKGEWNTPNYQVENEAGNQFFPFRGAGNQKVFQNVRKFKESNITSTRYSIEDLESVLKS